MGAACGAGDLLPSNALCPLRCIARGGGGWAVPAAAAAGTAGTAAAPIGLWRWGGGCASPEVGEKGVSVAPEAAGAVA